MILVYIVEDDRNIREIESFALKNSGYEVEAFDCAGDLYRRMEERLPDLLLLDIMLPDEDGLSIVKKVRGTSMMRELPIILVTAKTTELDKVKGLDMGADDYLTKPFGVMELISRVKALLRRSNKQKDEKKLTVGSIVINDDKHQVYIDNELCKLTYKEYELLKLFLQNPDIVLSRGTIMDRIWGDEFEGESRTLDMHIKTLRKKMKEEGDVIKTVRNVGYCLQSKGGTNEEEN